jgi:hypothetical protein
MATLQQIREGIKNTIRNNTSIGLSAYDYVTDLGEVPAIIVEPENTDFEGSFNRGMYVWKLRIYVLASRGPSGEHGQMVLDQLLDYGNSDGIPKILFDHHDLGLADGTDCELIQMFGYGGEFAWSKIPHVGAILRVRVITDPRG